MLQAALVAPYRLIWLKVHLLALVSLQCRCALPPYQADLKLSINSVNRYKLQMGAGLVVNVIQGHS